MLRLHTIPQCGIECDERTILDIITSMTRAATPRLSDCQKECRELGIPAGTATCASPILELLARRDHDDVQAFRTSAST